MTSVNFFDINNKKKKSDYNILSGTTPDSMSINTNKYTKDMAKIDKELTAEGLKIEKLTDEQKWNYVNSLTDQEYNRLSQYRDAGYSFGSAKALVDLEREMNKPNNVGGYRGVGFQISEPAGGEDSLWNLSNIRGRVAEAIDDWIQGTLIPKMTVSQKQQRSKALTEKYNNMSEEEWNSWVEKWKNDPEAKRFVDDTLEENVAYYWREKNRDAWDKFWNANVKFDYSGTGKPVGKETDEISATQMLANAPASAIGNASAVVRGMTNPFDNGKMLAELLLTQEGRDMLAYRYLDEQGRTESAESDPVGWVLDLFDLGALGLNVTSRLSKRTSKGSKLLGMNKVANTTSRRSDNLAKASNTLENVADMGISQYYSKILDRELSKLSQGGKIKNLIGDYISMTQRPLVTIWNGANPNNEQGQQQYQNGQWTYGGISKTVDKLTASIKDRIQTSATGLTPEIRERIRQNPYIKEYRERIEAMLQEEGAPMDNQRIMEEPIEEVGNELLRRLEEYETRLEENGKEYQVLRSTTRPYDLSNFMFGVYDVFAKNGITVNSKGELEFSRTANPADMNPIKTAWYVIKSMEPALGNMTIDQLLDFRMQLRSLIKYHSDAPSTKYSKNVIRQLVDGALNKLAHKEIPSLAKVDEIYSNEINELTKFKDGLVYQVGEKKGQIKDNFYSIMSTLNTQNRQKMKERIERIFPGIGERIEAIRMLPTIAKAVQTSPQMMRALFQRAGFLGGIKQSGGVKEAIMGWLLGIIADELFAKPLGEKRREEAINELIDEVSPEAIQKLQIIKSKIDAGVQLSEQEKRDLATAMQEIAIKEMEYLDEKHQKAFQEILQGANNKQPQLPGTMDTIGPDGTIKLSAGKQVNNPEEYTPKTREQRMQEIQEEYQMEGSDAEGMADSIENFLDDIGGDINGEINPREVNYERFSTRTLEKLMDDRNVPRSEKNKIEEILVRRGMENEVDDRELLDRQFAWEINKLTEREKKILGMKGKAKSQKEYMALEKDKERLKERMGEQYGNQSTERVDEKYADLESKPLEYINEYKKSKEFKESESEKKVLGQLQNEWKKQPEFLRKMDDNMNKQRQQIIDKPLNEGYERQTTSQGDRFVNKQTGQYGAVKYNDGNIEAVFPDDGDLLRDSGVIEILPSDARIRFEGDQETMSVGYRRGDEYQTVGRANPDEKTITAEEGLNIKNFKGDKTIGELADEYGLSKQIVEKIFTTEGEEALGRARGNLIELAQEIKEGTAPHEVFHSVFNMVNNKRRTEIIDMVMKNKNMSEADAREWLADSFSEYFRTGKFDTKPIPKGFINKVKRFFNQVKEFIKGIWKDKKKIQKLFDDIMDGKIEINKMTPEEEIVFQEREPWGLNNLETLRFVQNMQKKLGKNSAINSLEDGQIASMIDNMWGSMEENTRSAVDRFLDGVNDAIKKERDGKGLTSEEFETWRKELRKFVEERGWEYQIQQKSLFEADDPLNGYKSFDYAKLNDSISALYDIAHPIARDNNYAWDAFLNQLGLTYSPDLEIWRDRLNEEGIKIDNDKLVRVYNGIRKIANEPRSEFVLKRQTNNTVMNALNKITEKMKANPLDIPMEYGEMNNALKQQDWSPLERYLEKHPENINALWKTYDPDVVEWRDNLEKKFTGGGYISLTELYGIKNMLDDYIKTHPEDTKIEGTIDDVGIKFLVDKARYREKNNGKIGSYDKRQIEKVGFETNDILSNRITEVSKHMKSIDPDEYNSDFVPEVIRELGKTYDPDIEQWQKNLEEPLRQIINKYGARKAIAPGKQIVTDSGLNGLKAKINELEKYSHNDIFNAFEGQEAEVFFRAVKPRIDELKAKGAENVVRNLVALHNLGEDSLRKLIENFNGKDPMPSIAVMDVNVPHEVFGDISLVFGRDTVDPKVDERNKIYGSDAWTPTFPRIKETGGMFYDDVRKFASDTVDNMIDNGVELTPEEAGYLSQDIGNMILEFDGRSDLKTNAGHLAEQIIENLSEGGYKDFIENNDEAVAKLEGKIENFLQSVNNDRRQMIPAEYFLGEKKYYTNADYVAEELVDYVSDEVRGYYDEGDNRLLIRDITKTLNKMHDFQSELLEDLGSEFGIEDSDRVRTLLDTLKMVEQGDRPLTPENVLIAMKNQRVGRENNPGSYRDMIEIEGAKLNDIEDVRRQNFAKVFHGDRTGDLGDLEGKYDRLLYTVAKDIMGYDDTEIIQSQNMLRQEIKRSYDKDAETFKKNLVEENEIWDAVPNELLQRIIDVVEQGKKIPIRFSESKPERIVNLMEEVQYILVPEGADASQVKSIVRGTPLEGKIVPYKPDNNSAPRSKKLKELQKKYGNIFFSMGGVVMPIAMLLLMMQGEDDEGEGQQA